MSALDAVGVFSPGLWRLRGLSTFLGARRVLFRPGAWRAGELDAVVGWGHKPTAEAARAFSRRHGVPYVALEDGFLRSVGLGPAEPPLSLVVDDLGIYYDARGPSALEALLAGSETMGSGERWESGGPRRGDPLADAALLARARRCREAIAAERLSKYNHAPDALPRGWDESGRTVLVVDQTYDDASVVQGRADGRSFSRMLEAACDEHPGARIVVKVHPATVSGKKRGYLAEQRLPAGVERLAAPVGPVALLERCEAVYVCTSQLGFEALMLEKPVRCFGMPFYAGWGLSRDELSEPRRDRTRSIDALVAAALLLYPRYRHPVREQRCEAEEIIEHLALQRRRRRENERTFHCLGFSTWKRPFVRRFLAGPEGGNVRFRRRVRSLASAALDEDAVVVIWGVRASAPALRNRAGERVPVWRMEDGFLRSVRLGSELTPPGSLVLDRRGMYFDPSRPSDLEHLLSEARFAPEELERARQLRRRIVSLGVSKYNPAARGRFRPKAAPGQPVALAVGQVEDDASVKLGSPVVRSNAALLRAARALRPDAWLLYKPHPDVLSGNRKGHLAGTAESWDEVVEDVSVAACLEVVDEVHTMCSLVGFEALMRKLPVVCHGQPFYAGWGLTDDRAPIARRTRRLSLDELVAGTLLRYPRYYSWRAEAFCTAEDMVTELSRAKQARRGPALPVPWVLRRLRDVAILSREWLHAR